MLQNKWRIINNAPHSTINDNIWASLQNAQIQALKTLDQRPAEKFAQQMYETRYADNRTKLPQANQIAQFTAADALAADRQLFSSPADITFVIVGMSQKTNSWR